MRCYVHDNRKDLGEPGEVCPGLPDLGTYVGSLPTLLPSHSPGTERQDCPPSCHRKGFGFQRGSFSGIRGYSTSTSSSWRFFWVCPWIQLPLCLLFWGPLGWPACLLAFSPPADGDPVGWGGGMGRGKVGCAFSPCLACMRSHKLLILPVPEVSTELLEVSEGLYDLQSQRAG